MKKKKEEELSSKEVSNPTTASQEVVVANEVSKELDTSSISSISSTLLPLVPSRTFNYWSKAPNTEIALSNKPPIKFKGNSYQTSDSHEISILDDMVKRIPNVFSKVG
jgi:hypothetical protein